MTALALPERDHVFEQVAAEQGIDPERLLAEIADTVREPFVFGAGE